MKAKISISIFYFIISCSIFYVKAQDINLDKDNIINNIIEMVNIGDENQLDEAAISELVDILNYYLDNPININTAEIADFEKLVFINPIYISAIINYRKEIGKFTNINELNFIDIIDESTLDTIKHFFTINNSITQKQFSFREALKQSKHELFLSYYQTLKKAYGYSTENGYLGQNLGFRGFYKVISPDHIYANLQLNSPPGAPFGRGSFASGYVLIKNLGIFKSIHIGDYQLQFGQGLVFWGGYSLNKSYDPINVVKTAHADVLYNSSLTYGFNRGLTLLLEKKDVSFRPFFSYKGVDANIEHFEDSRKIRSILNNGYYRTKNELNFRNAARELTAGLIIGYNIKNTLDINALISSISYNYEFASPTYLYKKFQNYDRIKNYISLSYNYHNKNYILFGESSTLNFKEGSLLLGSTVVLDPKLILSIVYRYFSLGYIATYARPISEDNNYNDESGLYTGIKFIFNKKLQFNVFTDIFKSAWLKYQVDAPSDGVETGALLIYSPFKYLSTTIKYKIKTKALNDKSSITSSITYYQKHTFELNNIFNINEDIIVKTYIETSKYDSETGIYLGQELKFKIYRKSVIGIRYGIFSTDSYNTRIYISEYFMPYSWPFVMLYGKGSRLAIFVKHNLYNKININFLYSLLRYQDINSIGSGLSEIKGNIKPYIKLQLIYKI